MERARAELRPGDVGVRGMVDARCGRQAEDPERAMQQRQHLVQFYVSTTEERHQRSTSETVPGSCVREKNGY